MRELASDGICFSDQSYYGRPAEKNSCCGAFLSTDGSCGAVFGDGEISPSVPFGTQHPAICQRAPPAAGLPA